MFIQRLMWLIGKIRARREYDGSINYNKHNIHYCWYHLFSRYFIMSKANGRGTPLSTRQSNPPDTDKVYLSDIKEGMALMKDLLDKQRRLKNGGYN